MHAHSFFLASALALCLALPSAVRAQSPLDLIRTIRQGGGWVSLPVTDGRASLSTDTLPTLGLEVDGCFTIWPGHSGTWMLGARDPLNNQRLDAVAHPGEGVRFSYQTGTRSALDVTVRWSEPRDTVLHLWVGVDTRDPDRDTCAPRYQDDSADSRSTSSQKAHWSRRTGR